VILFVLLFTSAYLVSTPLQQAIRKGAWAVMQSDSQLLWESYELYEQALLENPTNPEIYFNYSSFMSNLYDYSEIKQVLDRAKSLELSNQDEAKLYYYYGYLGMIFSDPEYKTNFEKSREIYDTIEMDAQLVMDKLMILNILGKHKEAKEFYNFAIETNLMQKFGNSEDILEPFTLSSFVDNMNSTRNSFFKSLNLYPNPFYKSLHNVNFESSDGGRSFQRIESKQSALKKYVSTYRDSIKTNPTQISHYLNLANALTLKEDYETVEQALLPALDENITKLGRAQIYNSLGFLALYHDIP